MWNRTRGQIVRVYVRALANRAYTGNSVENEAKPDIHSGFPIYFPTEYHTFMKRAVERVL